MTRKFAGISFILAMMCIPITGQEAPQAAPRPSTQDSQNAKLPYFDRALSFDQRAKDLVSRMTLEEKISQMQDAAPAIPRLGIPSYNWWNEGLHGVARAGHATVFPQAIGLAATWDNTLVHNIADVISTEARAKYNDAQLSGNSSRYFGLTFWSPNINIFRDPRWGRGQETYGEDPFLTSRLGVAFVTGLQGDDPKYLKTVSTPKHFAVHSGPDVLRHRFDVNVSPHDFEDTYSPAFRATIVEGHADSVMCAYNSVRGLPACASPFLLDTLRKSWGFSGYVVSDCGAIGDIYRDHGYVLTIQQAAALAVKAGTDLSCGSEYRFLSDSVRDRLLTREDLDQAVMRLFEARFRLGMFDPPEMVPWSKLTIADNDTDEHRALALQAARESIVLLKNDHGTLPIKPGVKTIAVIGPVADSLDVLLGNYNGTPSRYTTLLDGIQQHFHTANVLFGSGSALTETSAVPIPQYNLGSKEGGHGLGLVEEVFNNPDLQGDVVFRRIDPQIDFGGPRNPSTLTGVGQNMSIRWHGEMVAPVGGVYLLGCDANGGFRLYLDGERIVDDWIPGGERQRTVFLSLQQGSEHQIILEYRQGNGPPVVHLVWSTPGVSAQEVNEIRKADVIVAVVGITPQLEGEEMDTNAPGFFGGDRVDLDLPRPQQVMLETLAATGKPLVVVLTNGSALAVNWAQEHAAAVLDVWYPGEEGGAALADVLSGDYNPSGRLPVTFYTGVSQLPPFSDYSMAGRTYRYFRGVPLYPFGFGLSYATFSYSNARADRSQIAATDSATVSVEVKNTGALAGDEVVELYLSHPGVEGAPIRALEGFTRIHLDSGEQKTVSFTLHDRELSIVDGEGKRKIMPGQVSVWIGGGQPVAGHGHPIPPGAKLTFRITTQADLPD